MRKKSEIPFLKALLEKSGRKESLIEFFPPEKADDIRRMGPISADFVSLLSPLGWAEDIHYSWFFEILKPMPKTMQMNMISLLSPLQAKGLTKLFEFTHAQKVSHFLGVFYMHLLKKKMMKEDVLPKHQIPFSEMNVLLDLNNKQLIYLIDLLGIYDLAQDLRQIVDKEILEKIYAALPKDMLQFLQYCSRQPVKWVSPKLNLQSWDGSKKQLNGLLHQRGLFRLARALSGENPHFQWHLFHRLDTARVKVMQSSLIQKYEPVQVSYFKNQVLDLAKRVQKS